MLIFPLLLHFIVIAWIRCYSFLIFSQISFNDSWAWIIATVGGSLYSVRVCVHVLISLLQEVYQEQPITVKISAKWLEKRLFTPRAFNILYWFLYLNFSKRNDSFYRCIFCRIVSTNKVTHIKQVVSVVFFTIFN